MESRMSRKILIFFIAILLVDCVSAVNIGFFKDKYMAEDSVQAWIDFENLTLLEPLTYSNIKLYDDLNRIPVNLNLYKIDNKYFVYFELPNLEAKNYNFVLENIRYSEGNFLRKSNFNKNLTVVDGHGISVIPGLVYLNIESWENPRIGITVKNKAIEDINVSFEANNEYIKFNQPNYEVNAGESYTLNLILEMRTYSETKFSSELNIKYLNSSYRIPIIVNKPATTVINSGGKVNENVVSSGELKFIENADNVERSLREQDSLEGPLNFKNFGNETLYGLVFDLTNGLDKVVSYKYEGDYMLEGGEQENVYLYINKNKDINKNYSGDLIVKAGNQQIKFPFLINYIPEEVAANQTIPVINESYYIYNYSQIPVVEEKSNALVLIIFGLFFIVLLYLIYYFYKKGKPENKKFDSLIPTFSKR